MLESGSVQTWQSLTVQIVVAHQLLSQQTSRHPACEGSPGDECTMRRSVENEAIEIITCLY